MISINDPLTMLMMKYPILAYTVTALLIIILILLIIIAVYIIKCFFES